jgi:hypothetical protein
MQSVNRPAKHRSVSFISGALELNYSVLLFYTILLLLPNAIKRYTLQATIIVSNTFTNSSVFFAYLKIRLFRY